MVNKLGAICAVHGCKNYKQQKGESRSFFRMPKNRDLLKAWIAACKRPDLDELLDTVDPDYFYRTCVVCSDHFQIECFRNKNLFSQGLLPGTIPTEKLYNVEPAKERKISEQIDDIDVKEIKLEQEPDEELADAFFSDSPAFHTNMSSFQDLLEENKHLKQMIHEYRVKLKHKASIIWKYRRRNQVLQQTLLKYKKTKVKIPISSVARPKKTRVYSQGVHSQIELVGKKEKGTKHENDAEKIPLDLFYCSTNS